MSDVTVKRPISETNAEQKWRFIAAACLISLIAGSVFLYLRVAQQQQQARYEARRRMGQMLVEASLLRHHWAKLESDEKFQSLAQKLGEELKTQAYTSTFIRSKSSGEGAPADEFESRVLKDFSRLPATAAKGSTSHIEFEDRTFPEKNEYQYYQPVRAKAECIDCHIAMGSLGGAKLVSLKAGDLMAVVKIAMPVVDTE